MHQEVFRLRASDRFKVCFILLVVCLILTKLFFPTPPDDAIVALHPQAVSQFSEFSEWLQWLAVPPAILIFLFYMSPLMTRYSIDSYGIWLREYGPFGIKTSLAHAIKPWEDIARVGITNDGRIRIVFNAGDMVESYYPVAQPGRFENQSRHYLEEYRRKNPWQIPNTELIMGDKLSIFGSGSTIVSRSTNENSFNKTSYNEETADILKRIEKLVKNSGNRDAATKLEAFNKELQKAEPNKLTLASLWQAVVAALPVIDQAPDVVEKIKQLFER